VKANVANAAGELRLDLPAGWKAEPRSQAFKVPVVGEQQEINFDVTPPSAEEYSLIARGCHRGLAAKSNRHGGEFRILTFLRRHSFLPRT